MYNSFDELARNHKSIRSYKTDNISRDDLEAIIMSGQRASSSGNMQSWSVVATSEYRIKEQLYKVHLNQNMILEAPYVLTFTADFNRIKRWIDLSQASQSFDDLLGFLTGMIDASLAAQNIALSAESKGLGICYMGTTLWAAKEIAEILDLPKFVVPITSLVIGKPAEFPKTRDRLPLDSVLHYEKYKSRTDKELLSLYEEKEKNHWERIKNSPETIKLMEENNIKSIAGLYTADFKYSKKLHTEKSIAIISFLKDQGFWNH